jgi:hypothetical protein
VEKKTIESAIASSPKNSPAYDGNPAFLQQIATTIANICGWDIAQFLVLQPDKPMFVRDIRTLMANQLERLSEPERLLVEALAQAQTPVSLDALCQRLTIERILEGSVQSILNTDSQPSYSLLRSGSNLAKTSSSTLGRAFSTKTAFLALQSTALI